jgi:hypothetical protein
MKARALLLPRRHKAREMQLGQRFGTDYHQLRTD